MQISNRYNYLVLTILAISTFVFVFGEKLLRLDDWLLANAYDGLKNYFNYLYYTKVQDEGGLWDYFGMNFPYHDNLFYTDATPILALLVKVLGLKNIALPAYNLFFISNLLISPFVAFQLGKKLGFMPVQNWIFSLFIVWVHPMVLYIGEWTNLSLSIYFLLASYFLVSHLQSYNDSHFNRYKYLIYNAILIFVATLTHLYYLPMLVIYIGAAYGMAFLLLDKKQSLLSLGVILLPAVFVLLLINLVDPNLAVRPDTVLGYDAGNSTCSWSDYFKSYNYLSLPSLYEQTDWNLMKLKFMGSAFPLTILFFLVVFFKKYKPKALKGLNHESLIVCCIFFAGVICLFTSMGSKVSFFGDAFRVFNIFNPLNIAAEIVDTFKQFRSMSRFGLPAFTGITISVFYVLSYIQKRYKAKVYLAIISFIMLVMCIDIVQSLIFYKSGFNGHSPFTDEVFEEFPDFDDRKIDAILPIPYYHLGTEKHGLIIDDKDNWSKQTYQMAIKYKSPLMACKMSRIPIYTAENLLSLFSDNPNKDILERLKGKSVLIPYNTSVKPNVPGTEPAKNVSANAQVYIEKWSAEFLVESKGVKYYLKAF